MLGLCLSSLRAIAPSNKMETRRDDVIIESLNTQSLYRKLNILDRIAFCYVILYASALAIVLSLLLLQPGFDH